ncbi:MAG: outer membrane beta-barrel protein [Leeuwenhoekiella sp.]
MQSLYKMKHHLKTYFGLIALTFFSLSVGKMNGQSKSEVSVFTGGVITNLAYDVEGSEQLKKPFKPSLGLGYSFYIKERWALNLEVHYQNYQGETQYGSLDGSYMTVDNEGESFEFRYTLNGFTENQNVDVLHIPLTVQFETKGNTRFFARVGGQIGLLLASEYESAAASLTTSGFYPQFNAELFDPQFMGFGQYNNVRQAPTDLGWQNSFDAVVEAGVKYSLGNYQNLYIGLVLNYGLNALSSDVAPTDLLLYQTQDPENFVVNSLFDSGYAKDARLRAFGIKLRYGFNGFTKSEE